MPSFIGKGKPRAGLRVPAAAINKPRPITKPVWKLILKLHLHELMYLSKGQKGPLNYHFDILYIAHQKFHITNFTLH